MFSVMETLNNTTNNNCTIRKLPAINIAAKLESQKSRKIFSYCKYIFLLNDKEFFNFIKSAPDKMTDTIKFLTVTNTKTGRSMTVT